MCQTYRPGIIEKYCVETVEREKRREHKKKNLSIETVKFLKDNLIDCIIELFKSDNLIDCIIELFKSGL